MFFVFFFPLFLFILLFFITLAVSFYLETKRNNSINNDERKQVVRINFFENGVLSTSRDFGVEIEKKIIST